MGRIQNFLGGLLALMLMVNFMAISGHDTSHLQADTGSCTLCVHHSGSDKLVSTVAAALFFTRSPVVDYQVTHPLYPVSKFFKDHPGRAPPHAS